jgi:hypothetical protein
VYGTEMRLNNPLTEYVFSGQFLEHLEIPAKVMESVQHYLNRMVNEPGGVAQLDDSISRIRSYFLDIGSCPFYDVRDRSCR